MKCEKCDSEISYGNMLLRRLKRGDLKMTRQEDGDVAFALKRCEQLQSCVATFRALWRPGA